MVSYVVCPWYSRGGIPQHGCCGESGVGDEAFSVIETAVGTHTDYLNFVGVVLSELLNYRRFALASRSMRVPEPHQHWTVADYSLSQCGG